MLKIFKSIEALIKLNDKRNSITSWQKKKHIQPKNCSFIE